MIDATAKLTLDLAQIVMLGGLIWGLARMSKTVEQLTLSAEKLSNGLDKVGLGLGELAIRVSVLEDRGARGGNR